MMKTCSKCGKAKPPNQMHGRVCEQCRHKARYVRKTQGTPQECSGVCHDLFDTWTPESSYALGLLFTDGCVQKRGLSWEVSFSNTERSLVSWLHQLWRSNRRIYSHTNDRTTPIHITGVTSDHIGKRLIELGVPPRKSKELCDLPRVPSKFRLSYTRGLVDGDGSVSLVRNPRCVGGRTLVVSFVDAWLGVCQSYKGLLSDLGLNSFNPTKKR